MDTTVAQLLPSLQVAVPALVWPRRDCTLERWLVADNSSDYALVVESKFVAVVAALERRWSADSMDWAGRMLWVEVGHMVPIRLAVFRYGRPPRLNKDQ